MSDLEISQILEEEFPVHPNEQFFESICEEWPEISKNFPESTLKSGKDYCLHLSRGDMVVHIPEHIELADRSKIREYLEVFMQKI